MPPLIAFFHCIKYLLFPFDARLGRDTMFYVKGNAFLSALTSSGTTLMRTSVMRRREDPQRLGNDKQSIVDNINPATVAKKSLDFFPICFLTSMALILIPILCSLMATSKILESAISTNYDDNAGDKNSSGVIGNFNVPLAIDCPRLPARKSPSKSVRDLRPDDIRVVAGLGDR